MLAPLTSLVGECGHTKVTRAKKAKNRTWLWDEEHQIAFDNVKATIARDVVLAYPDYSQEFEMYTDALSKQHCAVITQGNVPKGVVNLFSKTISITKTSDSYYFGDTGYKAMYVKVLVS
jgi:hypothetical protein